MSVKRGLQGKRIEPEEYMSVKEGCWVRGNQTSNQYEDQRTHALPHDD